MLRVADGSPRCRSRGAPTADERGGRGLMLVEALADRWGIDPSASGKSRVGDLRGAFDA